MSVIDSPETLKRIEGGWNLVPYLSRTQFPYLSPEDREDLEAEGRHGLLIAARTYRDGAGAVFSTYASNGILNRMRSALKGMTTKKRTIPMISLQAIMPGTDETLESTLPDTEADTESEVIRRIQHERLSRWLWREVGRLSPRQRECIHLFYVEEMGAQEIGARLGITHQAVYGTKARGLEVLKGSLR